MKNISFLSQKSIISLIFPIVLKIFSSSFFFLLLEIVLALFGLFSFVFVLVK